MEKQIKRDVYTILKEQFGVNISVDEKIESLYLLGLMPRDLIRVVFIIENKYNFQFSKTELITTRFDSIDDIILTILQHF